MSEKTLQEILKENKERYNKRIEEQRKQIKKEQRKELIIVASASILIIGLLMQVLINMNNEATDKCIQKGYSQQTCQIETA